MVGSTPTKGYKNPQGEDMADETEIDTVNLKQYLDSDYPLLDKFKDAFSNIKA